MQNVIDEQHNLRLWVKKIRYALGRTGRLEAEDEEFLESNQELVAKLERKFFISKESFGDIHQLVAAIYDSPVYYVYGQSSRPSVDHIRQMIKCGHVALVDEIFDDRFIYDKTRQWIAAGINDRVDLSRFNEDAEKLDKLLDIALCTGNVEIVNRLIQDHGMTLGPEWAEQAAQGGNLELFMMCGRLDDTVMENCLSEAVQYDSDQILHYLLNNIPYPIDAENLIRWCLLNSSRRSLKLLLQIFSDFNIAKYSETPEGRDYPTLQYLLIHAKREIVEMYLANVAKFN